MSDRDTRCISITREAAVRLAADVRDIMRNPLTNDSIYYEHDESDMLKGYAMIVGPKDTPYSGGFYLFSFQFPPDYPTRPPVVTYCTNDGITRFNPNLYKGGKVCISILNTWKGEGWTGSMTLRAILVTLQTLLNDKPLLNEPGIRSSHEDYDSYHKIVEFKNWDWAINEMLREGGIALLPVFMMFKEIMKQEFVRWFPLHERKLSELEVQNAKWRSDHDGSRQELRTTIYGGMHCTLLYDVMLEKLQALHKTLKDKTKLKVKT
jgi:ubiquitin-protein ligase